MPEQDEPFTPESVDEQIEQLTAEVERHSRPALPEVELLQDLRVLYHNSAGARDRVRRRLQEYMERAAPQAQVPETVQSSLSGPHDHKRTNKMQYIQGSQSPTRKTRLALLAAVLFALLLVGALAVTVPLLRSISTQPGTTPAVPPGTQSSAGIYIGDSSGIFKVNPRTGVTLKTYPWSHKQPFTAGTVQPYAFLTDGKLLYVGVNILDPNNEQMLYSAVQALDPTTGATRWIYDFSTNSSRASMALANGVVYVNTESFDTNTFTSRVFALRAANGTQSAVYTIPDAITRFSVANGFLYAQSFGHMYGINLATRASWKRVGPLGENRGFTAFQVVNGIVYASMYDGSQSNLVAYRGDNGAQLWKSAGIAGKIYNFTIAQGVAYFGTDAALPGIKAAPGCNCDGRIVAYDLHQYKVLWQQSAGNVAQNYTVANGVLYASTRFPYAGAPVPSEFIALRTSDGEPLWYITNAWLANLDPALADGRLYVVGSSDVQFPNRVGNHLYALQPANGHQIWDKQLAATISAFLVEG
jgi:outer membrane protein assembly factor BamB